MLNNLAFILGTTLMYSTPLIFTSLGGVISENAGVVNIGLEGMMFLGAFIGAAVGYYTGNPWLGFIGAAIGGGLLACLHGIACVLFTADHVVSGIAINFIGPGIALFTSRLIFDGATMTIPVPQKLPQPFLHVFPQGSLLYYLLGLRYVTVFLALGLVALVWFLLYKTSFGLRIRSVGEHPEAADTLGINVYKVKFIAIILSGVFAGMGGAALSIAIVANFRATLVSGHGFIALAAMIFGKWKPQGAMLACLLFGSAQAFEIFIGQTSLPIPSSLLSILPYVITLVVLVGFVGKAVAPAADGKPFIKGGE